MSAKNIQIGIDANHLERDNVTDVTDVFVWSDESVDKYADVIAEVAAALSTFSFDSATQLLRPIAGELWQGRLPLHGRAGPTSQVGTRPTISPRTRALVFRRDGFQCTYCGKRAIPRCILVAISDVFPDDFAYHPNYAKGRIHPAFWALAPEADHVVAHSRGGTSLVDNLTTLHTVCNARKSNSLLEDLPTREVMKETSDWDGLLSTYVGLVAAGTTHGYRHAAASYHNQWFRNFDLPNLTGQAQLGPTGGERC